MCIHVHKDLLAAFVEDPRLWLSCLTTTLPVGLCTSVESIITCILCTPKSCTLYLKWITFFPAHSQLNWSTWQTFSVTWKRASGAHQLNHPREDQGEGRQPAALQPQAITPTTLGEGNMTTGPGMERKATPLNGLHMVGERKETWTVHCRMPWHRWGGVTGVGVSGGFPQLWLHNPFYFLDLKVLA